MLGEWRFHDGLSVLFSFLFLLSALPFPFSISFPPHFPFLSFFVSVQAFMLWSCATVARV